MVCHSTDSEQFDAYDMKELLEEIERRELVTGEDLTCSLHRLMMCAIMTLLNF